jgi:tripartite-type tricarboxylate transporter receptor subunit TctC
VHPSLPVKTVQDLIDLAKRRPGEINYGTGGAGTGPHLATELFRLMTGVNIMHIPYKGTPPAVNDLLAGRVQMMMALSPVAMPHVKNHKLLPLAISGKKRLSELPNVPIVADTVPSYDATTWYGVLVARGTPQALINILNREIAKAANFPEVTERLETLGFQVDTGSAEDFNRYIASETEKWRKVIAKTNIQTQ